MLLQSHKHIKLYDIRSVININNIKSQSTLNRLKQITDSISLTFVKETNNTLFDNNLHKLPYKGYLCIDREDFRGGLYEFVDKENEYIFDLSPGLFVTLDPNIIYIRKQLILSGERTMILIE